MSTTDAVANSCVPVARRGAAGFGCGMSTIIDEKSGFLKDGTHYNSYI
jgi:hypothetical protein